MCAVLCVLVVFVVVELIAIGIFAYLNHLYIEKTERNNRSIGAAMAKGALERLCLFLALYLGFPQMLIAFGAFKVGTKLGNDCRISNDYYLVGNLVSIILVFIVYLLCRDFLNCIPCQ